MAEGYVWVLSAILSIVVIGILFTADRLMEKRMSARKEDKFSDR